MANDVSNRRILDQLTAAATSNPAPGPDPSMPPSLATMGAVPEGAAVPPSLIPATGSTEDLESIASSPETLANNVTATAKTEKDAEKTEKDAHPGFLAKLGRIAGGATGLTDSGSSPQAGMGAKIASLAGRVGNGLAVAAGTPEQKQIAEEQSQVPLKLAQIGNEQEYRRALVGSKNDANDIRQQLADQQQQKAESSMRLKGYVPDEKTPGSYRPMDEDEVLADPILSQNRDLTSAATASKNAGAALSKARADALMNPNNPMLELKRQQIENTYKLAQATLGMRMHSQARQDQEHLLNYGQEVGGAASNTGAAPGTPGQAQAQPGGLSLDNAPDMMMVNPATGLPIPMKMLSALKPTMTEQNRADFAASAMHSADKIQQLVDAAKAQVGPFAGRTAELMAKAGLGDQFNQELQNYIRFTQSAATAAHTGRFSVPILEKMDKMIGPEMNPDQLTGAITSIKSQMAPYADTGWKPTVWEYRAWLGGAGTTPSGKKAPAADVVEYVRGTDGKLHPKGK